MVPHGFCKTNQRSCTGDWLLCPQPLFAIFWLQNGFGLVEFPYNTKNLYRDSKVSSCSSLFFFFIFLVLFIHLFILSCFLFIRCPCLFLLSLCLVYLICFMHWGNNFARVPVIHPISLKFYCDSCFLLVIRLHYVLL